MNLQQNVDLLRFPVKPSKKQHYEKYLVSCEETVQLCSSKKIHLNIELEGFSEI